jgi:hypothetical protein
MQDITLAADETAATRLVHDGETLFGTPSKSGSGNLGPFFANYTVSASISGGTVSLHAPNIIELNDIHLNYSLSLTFGIDLNNFLPHFCLPQVCVNIPCVGEICTPKICLSWPTISVPLSYSDFVAFTANFQLLPRLAGGDWFIDLRIVSVQKLDISLAAAAILTALGLLLGGLLAPIPFIGPFLAIAVAAILAGIGVASVTGLLGPILNLFVAGMTFPIYHRPQVQQVLPAAGPNDPAVSITVTTLDAVVQETDKRELVVSASIAA